MKKLYLHLGYAKTATTSFQETCAKNADALLKQGIFYPTFKSEHTDLIEENNHGHVFLSLYHADPLSLRFHIDNNVKNIKALHEDYINQVEYAFNTDTNLLISGEAIPNLSEQTLFEFRAQLEAFGYEITPFMLLRSPYAFSCSLTQDMIKWGLEKQDFYVQSQMITKIKKIFPEVQCYSFREACNHKEGALAFLFEKIAINYKGFDFVKANEGISNLITRVQERINKNRLQRANHQINQDFVNLVAYDDKNFKEKYLLTEEEYSKVKTYCDAENSFFKEHLGEEFTDMEIPFSKEDPALKLCLTLIERLEAQSKT